MQSDGRDMTTNEQSVSAGDEKALPVDENISLNKECKEQSVASLEVNSNDDISYDTDSSEALGSG